MHRAILRLVVSTVFVTGLAATAAADPCSKGYSACLEGCRRLPQNDRHGVSRCTEHCNTERANCAFFPGRAGTPPPDPAAPAAAAPAEAEAEPTAKPPVSLEAPAPRVERPAEVEAEVPLPHDGGAAEPTPAAPASADACASCRAECADRSTRRLSHCTYQCREQYRRTTIRQQKQCVRACECDVNGCDADEPGYRAECLAKCDCGPPAPGD